MHISDSDIPQTMLWHPNQDKIIEPKQIRVCVIGIGRIGLPTALSIANANLFTIGVDIREELVRQINSRIFPLKDEPGFEEIFNKVIEKNLFHATTKIEEAVPKSNLILLSLPTPMDVNNIPDYNALRTVGKKLGEIMTPYSVVVVESTIEPGFIENEMIQIIESAKRLRVGETFTIGVCPENANPGEILHDFTNLPRLVGGIDEKTTNLLIKLYRTIFPVELIHMPNCKTANAVKLTTNVFRDLNIAFINELSVLFEKLGIDTYKVLEAADKKYNFQVHYPGPGVGGPCLPVNSYQLLNSARRFDSDLLKLVRTGREINESMPDHVMELLNDGLKNVNKNIENCKILILGISYKPDVKDLQLSPAEQIVNKLKSMKALVKIYDPYFKSTTIYDVETESDLHKAIENIDGIIIITAHNEFKTMDPSFLSSKTKNLVVVDSRGIIDQFVAKKAGIVFRGIGRGKI